MNDAIASLEISGVSHNLGSVPLTIGRDDDNLVIVKDASVSGHHAVIEISGDTWEVRDLSSTNGTRVNGVLGDRMLLSADDKICFGSVNAEIKFIPHEQNDPNLELESLSGRDASTKRTWLIRALLLMLVGLIVMYWHLASKKPVPRQTGAVLLTPRIESNTDVGSRMEDQQVDPIKQFELFLRTLDKPEFANTGGVGVLNSGMSVKQAIEALKATPVTSDQNISGGTAFCELVNGYRYQSTLETGDVMQSIVVKSALDLPVEIECVALCFINDELFEVSYIYKPHGVKTVVPMRIDQVKAREENHGWRILKSSVLSAVQGKYTPVKMYYPNFFIKGRDVEKISSSGSDYETVMFHGASKSTFTHIAYIVQNHTKTGTLETIDSLFTYYENIVIVARFCFLDYARSHSSRFQERWAALGQKNDLLIEQALQKAEMSQLEEKKKKEDEERRKSEQMRKAF